MSRIQLFPLLRPVLALAALLLWSASASAQQSNVKGFDYVVRPQASVDEMLSQADFWALEIALKPMRMISVEVTDPATGVKQREFVWYLVYRIVNRPLARPDRSQIDPANPLDPPPREKPLFIPEFTLVSDDNGVQQVYEDVLIPEAQAAIIRRERMPLKNSVQIVGPIPDVTPDDAPAPDALYGVAMWRKLDPRVDFFSIFFSGLSSGYRTVKGPDGSPLILRRTIVQGFQRPGDEFDQNEREIRRRDDARWIYRPDDLTIDVEAPADNTDEAGEDAAPADDAAAE